jgi:hypothetical protein
MWTDTTLEQLYGMNVDYTSGQALVRGREGFTISQVPGTVSVDLGNNRTANMSVVPMFRTTLEDGSDFVIQVAISGLAPNADHGCSIGGVQVDFSYDATQDHPYGAAGTHTMNGKTTVRTSDETDGGGRLTGKFTMPEGIPNGSPLVVVSHYAQPYHSIAMTSFYGKGVLQTTTETHTTIGIPSPSFTMENRTQWQVGGYATSTGMPYCATDPIAQSFLSGNDIRYISAVDLYFSAKDPLLPITVQIREMINGLPGPTVYASTTLESAGVSISDDGSVPTKFSFDHVLGYKPNEYCFVVMPGSATTAYRLWVAELGAFDILTGDIIGPPMASGVMFHGPNNRTWEPWTKRDLKYRLYESNFSENMILEFSAVTGVSACQIILAVEQFIAPGTSVHWSYSLDSGVTYIPFNPDLNIVLQEIITGVKLRIDVTSLGGSYQIMEHVAGILFLLYGASAYYIANDVTFEDDLSYPNEVVCTLDISADGTNGDGDTSVTPMYSINDGLDWIELKPTPSYVPTAVPEINQIVQGGSFYTYEFSTPGEVTITSATNASPIVCTSTGHGYSENMVVDIIDMTVNTNANGQWKLRNVTDTTFELYTVDGVASQGTTGLGSGGTMTLAEFTQSRAAIKLETSDQARSPLVRNIGFLCNRGEPS